MKPAASCNFRAIGCNLRRLRMERGYSLQEIAVHLGVSYQQVQKYESGKNRICVAYVYVLQRLYGVAFESFFQGMEEYPKPKRKPDKCVSNAISRLSLAGDKKMQIKAARIIEILLA